MIRRKELREEIIRSSHLAAPKPFPGPFCTHSEFVRYVDSSGKLIVELHRYLRPDGSLGASGKLDPKRLRDGTTILTIRAK